MNPIDILEHGGGGFTLRRGGETIPMPDPRKQHYQWVLTVLEMRYVPGTPEDVPWWLAEVVFERWCAAWDLPEFSAARRLAYLVDHYRAAISHDLLIHVGADVGDLWRARRWTMLLDLLDRLPSHSQYASTVSMDEEHAEMLAEQLAARADDAPDEATSGPALSTWTPEVAALTNIFDAVRSLQHTLIAVNSEKGKAPEPPKPSPRPNTPLENAIKRATMLRRKAKHEALVARVLPHKAPVKG